MGLTYQSPRSSSHPCVNAWEEAFLRTTSSVSGNDHEVATCTHSCRDLRQRSLSVHGRPPLSPAIVTQLYTHTRPRPGLDVLLLQSTSYTRHEPSQAMITWSWNDGARLGEIISVTNALQKAKVSCSVLQIREGHLRNRQEEARKLSEDLLDDIELVRVSSEQMLLKAVRLARLIGDESALEFLQFELHGYQFTSQTRKYLKATGRLFKADEGEKAYCDSLGAVEANIRANEARLNTLSTPSLSGDGLITALRNHHVNVNDATGSISKYGAIRSAIIGELHSFASRTYYELTFSEEQASLFESVRQDIDGMLAPLSGGALQKVESIMERLSVGEEEATSQAMNTCRRLIDSFADAVFPAQNEPAKIGDQKLEVKKSHVLNRIDVFVYGKTESKSRRSRLRQTMRGIYERVSTGVHSDVTAAEARFLFLETYIVLGEIIALERKESIVDQKQ